MKTIDFSKMPVEFRIGEAEETDLRRSVGNALNRNTTDIGLADFARKIYYSDAPVEIPAAYVEEITRIIRHDRLLLAPTKLAVLKCVQETMKATPDESMATSKNDQYETD